MTTQYQIYALKYGERETKEGQFFFREASQKPLTLHFYIWVILGGPHPIVVDTGCTEPDARLKELRAFVSPAEMLARVRVKAAEVPMTLVSHLHWDHWGGYPYFPGSTFWIQREELEFWTGVAGQHETLHVVLVRFPLRPWMIAETSGCDWPVSAACFRTRRPA